MHPAFRVASSEDRIAARVPAFDGRVLWIEEIFVPSDGSGSILLHDQAEDAFEQLVGKEGDCGHRSSDHDRGPRWRSVSKHAIVVFHYLRKWPAQESASLCYFAFRTFVIWQTALRKARQAMMSMWMSPDILAFVVDFGSMLPVLSRAIANFERRREPSYRLGTTVDCLFGSLRSGLRIGSMDGKQ